MELQTQTFKIEDVSFIFLKHLDKILIYQNRITKNEILEEIRNLRDLIDRF